MSEPRKNHLSIDGGQVKPDENVATYKPIPDAESEFKSKPTLSKSKEKISDEAEEKLLEKEAEAKIVTRVDMADAKYVVGDHRNGDAKIELDANKRQFSGLTKEELLKYADDPFWVRLRWFMFVLFWAAWLCMLAGAIAIIIRAPKCPTQPPRTWYERGPLVDALEEPSLEAVEAELPLMKELDVQGVFVDNGPAYDVLDDPSLLDKFKEFVTKAKAAGVKVIVDLTPNFVSNTHKWFEASVNRTEPFDTYFTWAKSKDFVEGNGTERKKPNNWISTVNTAAWEWNEGRKEFYLNQFGADKPDLNFHNPAVVKEFDKVLRAYMKAGADGVRLHNVRQLLVNQSFPDDLPRKGQGAASGADHMSYAFYQHKYTSDQPGLDALVAHWSKLVDESGTTPEQNETVFVLAEGGPGPQRPRAFTRLAINSGADAALTPDIIKMLNYSNAVQLKTSPVDEAEDAELAVLSILLPSTPVFGLSQLAQLNDNDSTNANEKLSHLVPLRADASVEHGQGGCALVNATDSPTSLLACARYKTGHTGYLAVYNPGSVQARASLALDSLPAELSLHYASRAVRDATNYTSNLRVPSENVLVPAKSTVVFSYVPFAKEG